MKRVMQEMDMKKKECSRAAAEFSSSCGGTFFSAIPPNSCCTGPCGGQWPPAAITRLSTMCRSVMKAPQDIKMFRKYSTLNYNVCLI